MKIAASQMPPAVSQVQLAVLTMTRHQLQQAQPAAKRVLIAARQVLPAAQRMQR
jgi:hypothetical protein